MFDYVCDSVSGFERRDNALVPREFQKRFQNLIVGRVIIGCSANIVEIAMLRAVQAAKEAEISCALAKQTVIKMGQVAQEWISNQGQDHN